VRTNWCSTWTGRYRKYLRGELTWILLAGCASAMLGVDLLWAFLVTLSSLIITVLLHCTMSAMSSSSSSSSNTYPHGLRDVNPFKPRFESVHCGVCETMILRRNFDCICDVCRRELCSTCAEKGNKLEICEVSSTVMTTCEDRNRHNAHHHHIPSNMRLCVICSNGGVDWKRSKTTEYVDAFQQFLADKLQVANMIDVHMMFAQTHPSFAVPGKAFRADRDGSVQIVDIPHRLPTPTVHHPTTTPNRSIQTYQFTPSSYSTPPRFISSSKRRRDANNDDSSSDESDFVSHRPSFHQPPPLVRQSSTLRHLPVYESESEDGEVSDHEIEGKQMEPIPEEVMQYYADAVGGDDEIEADKKAEGEGDVAVRRVLMF
jgi:hypothetical protein